MPKLLLLLAFCSLLGFAPSAPAQLSRTPSGQGERGVLGDPQPFPVVRINKRDLRLSPGARIFDRSNRTIVHGQLPPGAEVFYVREQTGDVIRIYVLTEQERQAPARQGGFR